MPKFGASQDCELKMIAYLQRASMRLCITHLRVNVRRARAMDHSEQVMTRLVNRQRQKASVWWVCMMILLALYDASCSRHDCSSPVWCWGVKLCMYSEAASSKSCECFKHVSFAKCCWLCCVFLRRLSLLVW